jgi:hypothetical protein
MGINIWRIFSVYKNESLYAYSNIGKIRQYISTRPIPPPLGVILAWARRWLGTSTIPNLSINLVRNLVIIREQTNTDINKTPRDIK